MQPNSGPLKSLLSILKSPIPTSRSGYIGRSTASRHGLVLTRLRGATASD